MTPIALPPLVLRNGTRVENVLGTALEFLQQDSSYRSYDLAPVKQDDVLTEADIRVANAMIARMSQQVIASIHLRAPIINAALARVPPGATLAVATDAIPWQELEELMGAMQGIPEVKLARQTKVLHKKRPALIPILDSVVETYLRHVEGLRRTGDPARDAVSLIASYKRELDGNLPTLQHLRAELRKRGIDLTECRLLDLFIWAYSGTYTPLYKRLESSTPPGTPTDRVSSESTIAHSDGSSAPPLNVDVFRG